MPPTRSRRGVPPVFAIEAQEMYGELFDIPQPDELVFISSFAGGEVFRSGCCFYRGAGRVFYFSPGDQEYPVYHHPVVRRVIANGVACGRTGMVVRCRRRTGSKTCPKGGWRSTSSSMAVNRPGERAAGRPRRRGPDG